MLQRLSPRRPYRVRQAFSLTLGDSRSRPKGRRSPQVAPMCNRYSFLNICPRKGGGEMADILQVGRAGTLP